MYTICGIKNNLMHVAFITSAFELFCYVRFDTTDLNLY